MPQMNDDFAFKVELTADEVRAMYYAVSEALRLWPGSPQRPVEEQELLSSIKVVLFAMVMDMNFDGEDGTRLG